jgi:hypothetical protein
MASAPVTETFGRRVCAKSGVSSAKAVMPCGSGPMRVAASASDSIESAPGASRIGAPLPSNERRRITVDVMGSPAGETKRTRK